MTEYLNTYNTLLLLNTANEPHYPQDDLPEIVLAGRSDVEKPNFINTLLGRKNLAHTSSEPGKTQLLNLHNIGDKLRFIDVPGHGYAKVSKSEHTRWSKMIEGYLVNRDSLHAVVSLVDFRHDSSTDDVQMYNFLKYYEIPIIVVATKADKIPRGKWNKHESAIRRKLDFDKSDRFIILSSVNRTGLGESWDSTLDEL